MKDITRPKRTLIHGGNHTYFFDVELQTNGNRALVISEKVPHQEDHQITISEEHMYYFLKGFQRILSEFGLDKQLLEEPLLKNKYCEDFSDNLNIEENSEPLAITQ